MSEVLHVSKSAKCPPTPIENPIIPAKVTLARAAERAYRPWSAFAGAGERIGAPVFSSSANASPSSDFVNPHDNSYLPGREPAPYESASSNVVQSMGTAASHVARMGENNVNLPGGVSPMMGQRPRITWPAHLEGPQVPVRPCTGCRAGPHETPLDGASALRNAKNRRGKTSVKRAVAAAANTRGLGFEGDEVKALRIPSAQYRDNAGGERTREEKGKGGGAEVYTPGARLTNLQMLDTKFSTALFKNMLCCKLADHKESTEPVRWVAHPSTLNPEDFATQAAIVFEGLREGHGPWRQVAWDAAMAFLETGRPEIVDAIPQLIAPLKLGLNTMEPGLVGLFLLILQKLIKSRKDVGPALSPFLRHLLPVLAVFKDYPGPSMHLPPQGCCSPTGSFNGREAAPESTRTAAGGHCRICGVVLDRRAAQEKALKRWRAAQKANGHLLTVPDPPGLQDRPPPPPSASGLVPGEDQGKGRIGEGLGAKSHRKTSVLGYRFSKTYEIPDLVQQTLVTIVENGGRKALLSVKSYIPTFDYVPVVPCGVANDDYGDDGDDSMTNDGWSTLGFSQYDNDYYGSLPSYHKNPRSKCALNSTPAFLDPASSTRPVSHSMSLALRRNASGSSLRDHLGPSYFRDAQHYNDRYSEKYLAPDISNAALHQDWERTTAETIEAARAFKGQIHVRQSLNFTDPCITLQKGGGSGGGGGDDNESGLLASFVSSSALLTRRPKKGFMSSTDLGLASEVNGDLKAFRKYGSDTESSATSLSSVRLGRQGRQSSSRRKGGRSAQGHLQVEVRQLYEATFAGGRSADLSRKSVVIPRGSSGISNSMDSNLLSHAANGRTQAMRRFSNPNYSSSMSNGPFSNAASIVTSMSTSAFNKASMTKRRNNGRSASQNNNGVKVQTLTPVFDSAFDPFFAEVCRQKHAQNERSRLAASYRDPGKWVGKTWRGLGVNRGEMAMKASRDHSDYNSISNAPTRNGRKKNREKSEIGTDDVENEIVVKNTFVSEAREADVMDKSRDSKERRLEEFRKYDSVRKSGYGIYIDGFAEEPGLKDGEERIWTEDEATSVRKSLHEFRNSNGFMVPWRESRAMITQRIANPAANVGFRQKFKIDPDMGQEWAQEGKGGLAEGEVDD
mmetsp:Transcript_22942/g.40538  ORF Transcript_22942/g.40538 Transcript_22942/m.40538 type:complete len:1130 (-) Transcript_22942:396-3785(-)|eukprot:CAMPEP_0175039416 /NCGR_PEP_ID=MMETSP0052_2-20121109/565_1 /TAXON_ID=51329 ORGANISM="Polytomella parva, Strain SAG 63-3" /NCGR_SAMPLE_ID=MMETSP0052_2 /ASSEMBLY_ACC=CAM_ASM_000194 /LENGTH=1129 /DNA_ID=CAMNT_0016301253 /DNA_START=133 /DNA_END=3522 /DNA_ORIENTATION=+